MPTFAPDPDAIRTLAQGRTCPTLLADALSAMAACDYQQAHLLAMAAALVAASDASMDEALHVAGQALGCLHVMMQGREEPTPVQRVLLDPGIPVYTLGNDRPNLYGPAPAGASWRRAGQRD